MLHVHSVKINNGKTYQRCLPAKYLRNLDELEGFHQDEMSKFVKQHYPHGLPKQDPGSKREIVTIDSKYTTIPDHEYLWYLMRIGYQKIPKKLIDLLKPANL